MQFWAFLPKIITFKNQPQISFITAWQYWLDMHSQAQNYLQSDPKPFQQVSMKFKKKII